MLRYVLYPLFGILVLGAYAASAVVALDVSSVETYESRMPTDVAAEPSAYASAPIIWRTAFHGPGARPEARSGSGRGGGFIIIPGGGGGYSGGFGGK